MGMSLAPLPDPAPSLAPDTRLGAKLARLGTMAPMDMVKGRSKDDGDSVLVQYCHSAGGELEGPSSRVGHVRETQHACLF